ncbi:MAG: DEAD/DEAH box helicase [Desulfurellales bacterium]|nr:MAG: DEAD/DEAH box helicase [Desulfurellales bacterium]
MPHTPRPYQLDAVEAVKSHWRQGRRRVILTMPVGAGKTFCAERIIIPTLDTEWAQVFYIAHTEALIDQPAFRFADASIQHAFIKAGRVADASAALQFCSAATLVRRDVTPARKRDGTAYARVLVVVDEAHRLKSSQYISILDKLSKAFMHVYMLLLTATPYRLDGRGFADVADAIVEATTPRQLMDMGVLVKPRYFAQQVTIADGEDAEVVLSRPAVVGDVVREWQLRSPVVAPVEPKTICRAYSIAHSKLLTQRFLDAGVQAAHIDGDMTTAQRRRLLVGLAVTKHPLAIDVLCAGSNIFDEGFDSRASYEMLLPRGAEAVRAWSVLNCSSAELGAAELGAAEALALRRAVLSGVLPELRDFWPAADSGAPMLPPRYAPLLILSDAAPTASCGAWMQRQGRVVRSWGGDDVVTVAARSWQGVATSPPKSVALVLCHGGSLARHGPLIFHDAAHMSHLFGLRDDSVWAPKLKKGNGIAGITGVPTIRTCPGCLVVDVEDNERCQYCGTVLAEAKLPDEDRATVLVEIEAPVVASTPGIQENFLRARYGEMVKANRARAMSGKPPYKPGWPLVRFKSRFGFWPGRELIGRMKAEFGLWD